RPRQVGFAATPGIARGITLAGDRAMVVDSSGILMFDLTRPRQPTLSGSHSIPGQAMDLAVQGRKACIAAGTTGMIVLDLGQPRRPPPAVGASLPKVNSMHRVQDLLFTSGEKNLSILDIGDPGRPSLLGSLEVPWTVSNITVV